METQAFPSTSLKIALYEPEIPQNTGTLMRVSACFGVALEIIEPCGFVWNDRKLLRAGLDYQDQAWVTRHPSWSHFQRSLSGIHRLILLDPHGEISFPEFHFLPTDILLAGKESSGVPKEIREKIPLRIRIPMHETCRSLNVAIATALVLGEALRQTHQFPKQKALYDNS